MLIETLLRSFPLTADRFPHRERVAYEGTFLFTSQTQLTEFITSARVVVNMGLCREADVEAERLIQSLGHPW